MTLGERLASLRLVVVTGKGGTGKSVVTTALGHRLAAAGRRVLLLEVDPRENLHQLCGVPPSAGEIVEVDRSSGVPLYLQNLKPSDVVDWVVKRQVKLGAVVRRVLASPVYRRFVEGAPGLTEIAVLGHVLRLVRGDLHRAPAIDTVLLDAPATGHGIYLLSAARLFGEAVGHGPFAELALQVADFVDSPEKTGMVIVTQAEEMPVQEAIELLSALQEKLGRAPEMVVSNGLYPVLGDGDEASADQLWRRRREINDKELERLERHWHGPHLRLPLLAVDEGPKLVRALAERLAPGLAEGAMDGEEEKNHGPQSP